jgi:arabinosaccharide transport system substrate-binding protein
MNKLMRTLTIIIVLSVMVGLSAAGSKESSDKGNSTKLTLWTFAEQHKVFYEDAVQSWNELYPEQIIDLECTIYPYEQMHQKLLLAIQSNYGAPDISDIEVGKFSNYLKGNTQLVELNDIIDPEMDSFVKARVDIYSENGKVYGIPYHVGTTVMYYNQEIMDKAGVDIDSIITWEDYVEAGKKVVATTGIPMTTILTRDHWTFQPLIAQRKSGYFDKDGEVILDNDVNIDTLQFLYDMLYTSKIAIPMGSHNEEEYWGFMNQGGAASVLMPEWYMIRFIDYMPDLKGKMVIRPLPRWTPDGFRSAGMGGTATSVINQSQNIELAKQFLKYAKVSREGNIRIWEILGFDPPRWDVWDDPRVAGENKFTEYFGPVVPILNEVKDEIYPLYVSPNYPDAANLVRSKAMFMALYEKSQTPEEALREIADELRQTIGE